MGLDTSIAIADARGQQSNAFKILRKMTFNLKFHTQSMYEPRMRVPQSISHMQGPNRLPSTHSFTGRCALVKWEQAARRRTTGEGRKQVYLRKDAKASPRTADGTGPESSCSRTEESQELRREGSRRKGADDRSFYTFKAFGKCGGKKQQETQKI